MTTIFPIFPFSFLTENVHKDETIVKGHAHEESRKGKHFKALAEGGDDAGHGADQVAEDEGRDAAEPVGQVAQEDPSDDAAAKENGLGQRGLSRLVAHPVELFLKRKNY